MAAAAQRTGTMAKLAILAVLGGILAVSAGHPVWGFLIEFMAILLGGGWFSVLSS